MDCFICCLYDASLFIKEKKVKISIIQKSLQCKSIDCFLYDKCQNVNIDNIAAMFYLGHHKRKKKKKDSCLWYYKATHLIVAFNK